MEEPGPESQESTNRAKWSEATGQAILLAVVAWALFTLIQAPWYMPLFNTHPFDAKWVVVTFVTGALPPLLVLFAAFLGSWLIGAVKRRADPWRSWRDGLVVASVFTLLVNLGMLIGQTR